ncbi:HXXEE domain-containing protein [Spirochaeta isovalerica]|uniref:HXXEE domain-containing protein n=1 Tax=Spirochaeta isovalerica TaxID=150 RepID=A0A841RA55_9SPIO|nr:HXXEE domain-containing protein [Spirochaeta isovalerica]MBB6482254.1 hypothetical protein [Spirochaeta isovalerica]
MKLKEYYNWLKENWANTGLLLAFYLTIFLVVFVRKSNFAVFLILLQTPLYMLHQAEEYIFPGGFGPFFNRDIFGVEQDNEPIGSGFIFAINMSYIWILLPLFGFLSVLNPELGLWIPYFTIFAGVSHIALAIKARKLYNPGLIVSLLLNIPVGTAVVLYFMRAGYIDSFFINIHFPIGLGLNLLLPVIGSILYKSYKKKVQ